MDRQTTVFNPGEIVILDLDSTAQKTVEVIAQSPDRRLTRVRQGFFPMTVYTGRLTRKV